MVSLRLNIAPVSANMTFSKKDQLGHRPCSCWNADAILYEVKKRGRPPKGCEHKTNGLGEVELDAQGQIRGCIGRCKQDAPRGLFLAKSAARMYKAACEVPATEENKIIIASHPSLAYRFDEDPTRLCVFWVFTKVNSDFYTSVELHGPLESRILADVINSPLNLQNANVAVMCVPDPVSPPPPVSGFVSHSNNTSSSFTLPLRGPRLSSSQDMGNNYLDSDNNQVDWGTNHVVLDDDSSALYRSNL